MIIFVTDVLYAFENEVENWAYQAFSCCVEVLSEGLLWVGKESGAWVGVTGPSDCRAYCWLVSESWTRGGRPTWDRTLMPTGSAVVYIIEYYCSCGFLLDVS